MASEEEKWWRRALSFLGDLSTLYWLLSLLVGGYSLWNVHANYPMLPGLLENPAQYIGGSIVAFLGPPVALAIILKLYDQAKPRFLCWWNPHNLSLTPAGGIREAGITIIHSGERAAWEVRMKILRTQDNSPNPHPFQEQCYLEKDGRTYRSLMLKEGESANIELATIQVNKWGHGSWMVIHYAGQGVSVSDTGVIVRLEIRANPPLAQPIVRCYSIRRETGTQTVREIIHMGKQERIAIVEVSCE